jgi:transcription elongation factor GreB
LTCDDLACADTEVCIDADDQPFRCEDISCAADVQCEPNEHCDGICRADLCLAGHRQCDRANLGPDTPLDQVPEVVVIADGRLHIYNGQTGERYLRIVLWGSGGGGAPVVADFDGDGFPEIGVGLAGRYRVVDLQPPSQACPEWDDDLVDGEATANSARNTQREECESPDACPAGLTCGVDGHCGCLHNGWRQSVEDGGSRVTGSSAFDFNGDGVSEILYNDECWLRMYDGLDGDVLLKEPSESRTRIERPVVADVDNDGHAEFVFGVSNNSGLCSEKEDPDYDNLHIQALYNNGIEILGEPNDAFVSTRGIWNQHTCHATNVGDDGALPLEEGDGWSDLVDPALNSYRAQPHQLRIVPDLALSDLQIDVTIAGDQCVVTARTTLFNGGSAASLAEKQVKVRFSDAPGGEGTLFAPDFTVDRDVAIGESVEIAVALTEFPAHEDVRVFAAVDPDNAVPECREKQCHRCTRDRTLRSSVGMSQSAPNYITKEGYETLRDELLELRLGERPKVVQEVTDAAAQGDRSENAEYIYGKKRLREIDRRMRFLQKRLEHAVVIDPRSQTGDRIFFGATVLIEDNGQESTIQIVGSDEFDAARGRVSFRSPVGAALLGKEADDEVIVRTPGGKRTLTVLEVRYE